MGQSQHELGAASRYTNGVEVVGECEQDTSIAELDNDTLVEHLRGGPLQNCLSLLGPSLSPNPRYRWQWWWRSVVKIFMILHFCGVFWQIVLRRDAIAAACRSRVGRAFFVQVVVLHA